MQQSETSGSVDATPAEALMMSAQKNLTSLHQAWTKAVLGMMSAGAAEMDVTKRLCSGGISWTDLPSAVSGPGAALQWMHDARLRFAQTVEAQRHANDAFAAALFSTMEAMAGCAAPMADFYLKTPQLTNGSEAPAPKPRPGRA